VDKTSPAPAAQLSPQHGTPTQLPLSDASHLESNALILGAADAMWARNLLSRTLARHTASSFPKCSRAIVAIRMASTLPRLPVFEAIKKHDPQSTAVIHSLSGRRFTYGELVNDVAAAKDKLQRNTDGKSAEGERISFLVENGYDYVGAHPVGPLLCMLQSRQPLTPVQ
jgi:hypothetical protein